MISKKSMSSSFCFIITQLVCNKRPLQEKSSYPDSLMAACGTVRKGGIIYRNQIVLRRVFLFALYRPKTKDHRHNLKYEKDLLC